MSHKLVFLAVGIAIAIIAAFSICTTSEARAETNEINGSLIVTYDLDFEITELSGRSIVIDPEYYEDFGWEKGRDYQDKWHDKKHLKNIRYYSNHLSDTVCDIYLYSEEPDPWAASLSFRIRWNNEDKLKNADSVKWYVNGRLAPDLDSEEYGYIDLTKNNIITCTDKKQSPLYNISGQVWDAKTNMPVPFANVVYCQYNPWWDMYLPVEGVEAVKTDMWGWYTIEGITEEMLPGKVFVYDGIKKIGESEPIWFLPEDMETLYMWPIVINQEQPDPPVPPTPPDPPVPPGPNPPEPVPPVPPTPPTPGPTPVNPGGGIAQTGDNTGNALVMFAIVALLGAGVLTGRKLYSR